MDKREDEEKGRRVPFVGGEPEPGVLVEMLYQPEKPATLFAVCANGEVRYVPTLPSGESRTLTPYSPHNNLLKNGIVLFPSEAAPCESKEELVSEIRAFIHRYVDINPLFETIAVYYVLLTWVYEAFNELPYLRIRGDFGSGKTRFLLVVGSLVFRPIFASGASTLSPIFRILDGIRGTLLIDEGDFRMSDEKAELTKILNNGNARGFPVLRSEQSHATKEFNPVAYTVFGPKIVATRGYFQDRALESRFLTEESGTRKLRPDIPINLPAGYENEARSLRNKLLTYRFKHLKAIQPIREQPWQGVEPRLQQIFVPLLSLAADERTRTELRELAARYSRDLVADRQTDIEAHVLWAIRELLNAKAERLSIGDITRKVNEEFGAEYERRITERWVGTIVRRKLQLRPQRIQGVFVIMPTEMPRLKLLFERHGLAEEAGDIGDIVDVA
jgi:hypothetical protein